MKMEGDSNSTYTMYLTCVSHRMVCFQATQTCFAKMLTVERCGLHIGQPRYPEQQVEHEVALFLEIERTAEGDALGGCPYIGGTA